jgi:hypothetical protein
MTRPEIEKALAAAIDTASQAGAPWWPGSEMAPIAFRRLTSFARRKKLKKPKLDDRALDLAKGLQAHFEPDIPYTHPSEFLHLARILVGVWMECDSKS